MPSSEKRQTKATQTNPAPDLTTYGTNASSLPTFGGFSLQELWQLQKCYETLENGTPRSLQDLGVIVGSTRRLLAKLIERFEAKGCTGRKIFNVGHGQSRTSILKDNDSMRAAKMTLEKIKSILAMSQQVLGGEAAQQKGVRIRIAAGITACMSFIPEVIKEQTHREGSVPVTYHFHSVHSHSINERKDDFDILITEVSQDSVIQPPDLDSARLIKVPLQFMVPADHPLAKSSMSDLSVREALTQLDLSVALLEETRSPRPTYPQLQALNPNVQYEYVSAHAIAHSLCAAGSAAVISTPLLLSDEQRKTVRAVNIIFSERDKSEAKCDPKHDLGLITFRVDCPGLRGFRLDEDKEVIKTLKKAFEKRINEWEAKPTPPWHEREIWHTSFCQTTNGMLWAKGKIRWNYPVKGVVRGYYEFGNQLYRIDGNINNGPRKDKDERHLVLKGLRDNDLIEEFVASFIGSDNALNGNEPLVGYWLGRRLHSDDAFYLEHSLGYVVIVPLNQDSPKPIVLNKWISGLLKNTKNVELSALQHPPIKTKPE